MKAGQVLLLAATLVIIPRAGEAEGIEHDKQVTQLLLPTLACQVWGRPQAVGELGLSRRLAGGRVEAFQVCWDRAGSIMGWTFGRRGRVLCAGQGTVVDRANYLVHVDGCGGVLVQIPLEEVLPGTRQD